MSVSKSQIVLSLTSLFALMISGCAVYPPRISGYPTGVNPATHQALQQQHGELAARFQELNQRAGSLDADNQRLQALLAQQQQQTERMQASLQQSRDTVADLRDELTTARRNRPDTADYGSIPSAEVGFQPRQNNLPLASIPGAEINDNAGEVRVRLDGGRLFAAGLASIQQSSDTSKLLDDVVSMIRSRYPNSRVTIEGHTDSDPIRRTQWKNNQELSLARARAVAQALRRRGLTENSLAVAGFGDSRPIADNNTQAGKARNRRVEIVIQAQ